MRKLGKSKLVTDSQGLWVARAARKLSVTAAVFKEQQGEVLALLADFGFPITINRSQPLVYPEWVDRPLYPELEAKGPKKINIPSLEQWLHPDQKDNWADGTVIYEFLKNQNLLPTCLGFHEILAIQAKGLEFFRRYFQGRSVSGWKGVFHRHDGDLCIPVLCETNNKVILDCGWLDGKYSASSPAFYFAK